MGLFDRFKKRFESVGKDKKPRNVVEEAKKAGSKGREALPKNARDEKKKDKEAPRAKKVLIKEDTKDAYRILRHVVITEKASMQAADRQYTFAVALHANKAQVAEAVSNVYGVHPIYVNMVNVSGKKVRFGKVEGVTNDWKKAVVTLKEGEKIDLYEGV